MELLNCTRVTGFTPDGLLAVRNVSPTVPDPYDTWHPILPENIENPLAPRIKVEEQAISLNADLIVLAAGGRADDALFLEAQRRRVAPWCASSATATRWAGYSKPCGRPTRWRWRYKPGRLCPRQGRMIVCG